MGIGSISDYGTLLQNYKTQSISTVSVEEAVIEKQPIAQESAPVTPVISEETPAAVRPQSRELKLEDVSLSLKGNDAFEMTGRDSDIKQLDIQKAISDMKKDSILEQYQFFVGSSQDILQNRMEPDGIVIPKL